MSTIEMRLAQLQRISGLVLELPAGDRAAILALLNHGTEPAPVTEPDKLKHGRPRKTAKPGKRKTTGPTRTLSNGTVYRMKHTVSNALKGPFGRITGEHEGYREAMLAKHGAEWLTANAKRIGVRP
jgi:hypothetical protein